MARWELASVGILYLLRLHHPLKLGVCETGGIPFRHDGFNTAEALVLLVLKN